MTTQHHPQEHPNTASTHEPDPTRSRRRSRRPWALTGLTAVLAASAVVGVTSVEWEDSANARSIGPDPLRSEQWALDELRLAEAHDITTGCGTTIAIVDTGVDLDHPDLRDRLTDGIDFVDDDHTPDDGNGHGTHVAGIAAATMDNAIGIAGAAPCARIMPIRVLNDEGTGTDDDIAAGIRWAAEHHADVINLSLGEAGFIGRLRAGGPMNEAIVDANELGAVVVAASGNEGTPRLRNYRLDVPVIVVGAIAPGGEPAEFSNFGDPRTLVAPGVGILSTVPTGSTGIFPDGTSGYAELDGTSMASPYVAGVAALLVSQGHDPDAVEQLLFDTATDPGDDPRLGAGIVDAAAAVRAGRP
ncbi:MAG TPA: S8 family serine peptidase [Acidimicrobiia bacterium]|nr:S8 family serine peptidase [Acidimicrobiia bacterium]